MIRKVEKVHKFIDYYKNEVTLSFADHPFSKEPKHVWIICKYRDKWLLTKHKERGLEFPGGKVEHGETAEQGAIREITEETGGVVDHIHYIGQYYVAGKKDHVIKNSYWDINSSNQTQGVGRGGSSGINGLKTSEMTDNSAKKHMKGFDFGNIWETTSSYPILFWQ